jgi:DNA primase
LINNNDSVLAEEAMTIRRVWAPTEGRSPHRNERRPKDNGLVALHRQWHSPIKERKDAAPALGHDSTEANNFWVQGERAEAVRSPTTRAAASCPTS